MVHTEQVWYSANSWKKPIWYSLTRSIMFDEVIAALEKVKVGDYFFEAGVIEPGFDNTNGPLDRILSTLEK